MRVHINIITAKNYFAIEQAQNLKQTLKTQSLAFV